MKKFTVEQVSREFAKRVLIRINDAQRTELLAHPTNCSCCISDDMTDAIQCVIDAYDHVSGAKPDSYSVTGKAGDIMSAAWTMARQNRWYVS